MASYKLTVSEPVLKERQCVKPLMCGPGPCDYWPSVAQALAKPVISPICDEYYAVMADLRASIQYVFQTKSKLVLALSGSGHTGMETIISNLVGPNETLLIATRGIWDERAFSMATRYGIKVKVVQTPFNTTFKIEDIEAALKKHRPSAIFVTHGDSSTGSVQNLKGIGDLCHKYGALLLVDTVVSLCAEPFFMDDWGVDAVYTSSQKALSGPAGISPVAFSARAEAKINSRKHEPPFYFDIKLLAAQWNCYDNTRVYHHTLSPPLLWALKRCFEEICTETLPKSWARHRKVTDHFHRRLRENGSFKFLIEAPEDRLVTVTTLVLPKGYDYMEFVTLMRSKHNIMILGGLGPTVGKALRIGIMGVNSTIEVADRVADAMADTMKSLTRASL